MASRAVLARLAKSFDLAAELCTLYQYEVVNSDIPIRQVLWDSRCEVLALCHICLCGSAIRTVLSTPI